MVLKPTPIVGPPPPEAHIDVTRDTMTEPPLVREVVQRDYQGLGESREKLRKIKEPNFLMQKITRKRGRYRHSSDRRNQY